jgi:hypothetical protein
MKKQLILFNLLGLILCALSAPLAAANCYPCRNDCCEWSFCDGKIKLGADWLYWKVMEDNLDIGSAVNISSNTSQLPQVIQTSTVDQNFKYSSGFRVNLGYELPCDCWDVNVSYTYLPSNSKSSTFTSTNTDTYLFSANDIDFPILSSLIDQRTSPTLVSSKWNLTANNIDVDLGRTICFGECLKIRPHIGFRAAWFDQKLRYFAQSAITGQPVVNFSATLNEKFTGYGVEGGLWGEWQIGCGLSVVGHFGGSVLYSKFRIHQSAITSEVLPTPGDTLVNNGGGTSYSGTPTVDYFVGLQYADCLCDMLVSVHAGWEQHVLFDVNRLARDGNLSTQGLTLGFEVGF